MSTATWFQIYVKAPEGNLYITPQAMKRIDDHIFSIGAMMRCDLLSGMPIQEADGTWEVRVQQELVLTVVKKVLVGHYGLEIVREVSNS